MLGSRKAGPLRELYMVWLWARADYVSEWLTRPRRRRSLADNFDMEDIL